MNYNYECEPCGQHCLSCFHKIRGCTSCEDGYMLQIENECIKIESDKDWQTIMWVGIGLGITVFIVTIVGIWWLWRKPKTQFAKVGKATYEVVLQSSVNKTAKKNGVHVCGKCVGMCVRCNKRAGNEFASVCEKCKIKGKCAICKQIEDQNTPDVEAAIENEDDEKNKEFDLGRLCDTCAKIGNECYNCGATMK